MRQKKPPQQPKQPKLDADVLAAMEAFSRAARFDPSYATAIAAAGSRMAINRANLAARREAQAAAANALDTSPEANSRDSGDSDPRSL